jgi:phospholipid/cholesterol/gamma-HCH transport system substrate-binding protein
MNDSKIGLKVGFFVTIGLALTALLVLSFSHGVTLLESTYTLRILLPNAAGLKPAADVMMSGVPIGKAYKMELLPDGRTVEVYVSILSKYKIRTNALFHIDALGFLGDQYIAVSPPANSMAPFWKDGDMVRGESPFNLEEAVRSVADLLDHAKKMVTDIDQAVNNANKTVLSTNTLNSISQTFSNVQGMSDAAAGAARDAKVLIESNSAAVNIAVTNLREFSLRLNGMIGNLDAMVVTNRPGVEETLRNLRDTSVSLKQIAADLEAGQGLAGGLLKDAAMKAQAAELVSNANATASSLNTFVSNLNARGIWSMMWKPKHKEKSGKDPAP